MFVQFKGMAGQTVTVNASHVRLVEPQENNTAIYLSGLGPDDAVLMRVVVHPADEVVAALERAYQSPAVQLA